jgi:hypothetical protein
MQALHGILETTFDGQRQHIECAANAVENRVFILRRWPAQYPRRHLIAMTRVANTHAQTMELAVSELGHDIAQAVLAAVPAIELQAGSTGRQVKIVMRDQALLWLDLVVAQRRNDGDAALVHEGGRLQEPDRLATNPHPAGLAMKFAVESEALALPAGKSVNKPKPGVVPGSEVFGTRIPQPDNESQSSHVNQ